ncbi:MAG: hypothetical protein KatS3mg053_0713 [Candidatus Roseilinea sp.]|nr:MAG: hypothetical protein KatS3mg053_0713 [Candidatus Roseilinea sp.]
MILLNFAHPLTPNHLEQVEALVGQKIERVVEVHSQIDPQQPLAPQVTAMADAAELTAQQWQNAPILVNLPSLNYSAALLVAELHGRMGYFPPCLRLRPVKDALPPRFEVAEVLNLQAARDAARAWRDQSPATGG